MKLTKRNLEEWIKKSRYADIGDPDYGEKGMWDEGYDACLDVIEEDFIGEEDE